MFDRFNHATYLRRLLEKYEDLMVYIIGARSYDEDEKKYLENLENVEIVEINELRNHSLKGLTHLSIDLDVLDITSFASTTYPEPNGLTFHDIIGILKELKNIVNMRTVDIMEFNPIISRIQDALLVIRLIYEICVVLEHKKCI
jgi:arginase family enzyme